MKFWSGWKTGRDALVLPGNVANPDRLRLGAQAIGFTGM